MVSKNFRPLNRLYSAPIENLESRVLLSAVIGPYAPGYTTRSAVHVEPAIVLIKPAASTPVLAPASDSGVKGDHITNVVKPTFTGKATASSTVKIYTGKTLLGTGKATAAGAYSVTITTALANGVHPITATATNSAGTSPVSGALSLTILTTHPAAPSVPAIVSSATLTPTFTGTAPVGDTVTIYANGVAVGTGVATGGKYSITVSKLAAGSHSIAATATDVAGNISAKSTAVTVVLTAGSTSEIQYSYVTDASTYSVAPGGTVTVEIFLKETLPAGTSSLIAADGGLLGAGFSVTRTTGAQASLTGIAGSVTTNGSNFANGSFVAKAGASGSFQAGAEIADLSATSGPVPNASTDEIELGTVTIAAGAAAGTTKFTLANFKYPSLAGNFTATFNNGFNLDVTPPAGRQPYIGADNSPDTFSVTVT